MRTFPIDLMVDYLGIPHQELVGDSMNCRCPFCASDTSKKYKLNVNLAKNTWRCAKCGKSGGAVQLYTYVTRNIPYTKDMRNEIIPELEEFMGMDHTDRQKFIRPQIQNASFESTPYPNASDSELDILHHILLNNPLLKLSKKHQDKLLERGLTEDAILQNEYRSSTLEYMKNYIPSEWYKLYEQENWEQIKSQNYILAKMRKDQLLVALLLGESFLQDIRNAGVQIAGIPGLFKFKTPSKTYCGFRLYEGIVIPIRNNRSEIVALQVRKESANSGNKYMIVSSRGMPSGRIGRSRIHHPLANNQEPKRDSNTVFITEGALKADVFSCIANDVSVKVLSLVGVNSTKGLKEELKEMNSPKVYEAFDMDKLLNVSVMDATKSLDALCKSVNLELKHLFWDKEGTNQMLDVFKKYSADNGLVLHDENFNQNPAIHLAQIVRKLTQNNIKIPRNMTKWSKFTKGIDDYAYACKHGFIESASFVESAKIDSA